MTIAEEQRHYRYERAQLQRRSSIQRIQRSGSYASPGFVVALSLGLMAAIAFFAAALQLTTAFVVQAPIGGLVARTSRSGNNLDRGRRPTKIFLEDWVADMIDGELYRQEHHKEYEAAWMKKNKGAVLSRLSDNTMAAGYPSQMLGDREAFAEHKRDERMAFLKPEKYCADRCVATGNCDILEDFYEMGPEDVLRFCEECVLNFDVDETDTENGGEGGCEVPDAFYEKEPPLRP